MVILKLLLALTETINGVFVLCFGFVRVLKRLALPDLVKLPPHLNMPEIRLEQEIPDNDVREI
jgi:hypothetical protein